MLTLPRDLRRMSSVFQALGNRSNQVVGASPLIRHDPVNSSLHASRPLCSLFDGLCRAKHRVAGPSHLRGDVLCKSCRLLLSLACSSATLAADAASLLGSNQHCLSDNLLLADHAAESHPSKSVFGSPVLFKQHSMGFSVFFDRQPNQVGRVIGATSMRRHNVMKMCDHSVSRCSQVFSGPCMTNLK